MADGSISISEAELTIMKALWLGAEPMTAQDLSDVLSHKGWKYSTIATLCGRMVEKGSIRYERRGRFHYYTPTVKEEDYRSFQTKTLVSRLYNGSAKSLVAALFENEALSKEDIDELRAKFDL